MAEKKRFIFVDLLRGLALLVMIEVHVFNTFINPAIKAQPWFALLDYINGLVAPSFLFVSGFAFILSTNTAKESLKLFSPVILKRLARIGLIFLVGYTLHLPKFSFSEMQNLPKAEWIPFYNVDILQCIATGLFLLLIMKLLFTKEKIFNAVLLFVTLMFIFLSPLVWQYDFTNIFPLWFANFINTKNGSLFPVFPWLGFMFIGAITATIFLRLKEDADQKRFFKYLIIVAVTFIIMGHLVLTELTPVEVRTIRPNPFFFMQRLGYVLFLLVICWHFNIKKNIRQSFILDFSRESLLVYWLHLTIIFAVIFNGKNLELIFNYRFGIWECILATVILVLVMVIVSKLWGWFKRNYKRQSKYVVIATISVGFFLFIIL